MRSEIPAPVAVAIIAVVVVVLLAAGYFYFFRKEVYQPPTGKSPGQVQQLRPVVPGQEGAPQAPTGQGGTPAQVQGF